MLDASIAVMSASFQRLGAGLLRATAYPGTVADLHRVINDIQDELNQLVIRYAKRAQERAAVNRTLWKPALSID